MISAGIAELWSVSCFERVPAGYQQSGAGAGQGRPGVPVFKLFLLISAGVAELWSGSCFERVPAGYQQSGAGAGQGGPGVPVFQLFLS